MTVNIVLPVFNEELRIENGIRILCRYLEEHPEADCRITIVDNASTDRTEQIAREICENNKKIEYIRIAEKGVGIAFRTAVQRNQCQVIGYMDIDMSTDLSALSVMYKAFCKEKGLQIVNASRYHRKSELVGRKWYRNLVSYILVGLLKCVFGMKASDAICGFKFFKKDAIEELLRESGSEAGWFLIIEALLRAEKKGMQILELPVKWVYEEHTTVNVKKVATNYLKQIIRLKKQLMEEQKNAKCFNKK